MKVLIVYHSYSGNTKDLAEFIKTQLSNSFEVDLFEINKYSKEKIEFSIDLKPAYDTIILGTFTWGKGEIPIQVRKFVKEYQEYFKTKQVFLFGTGDTQFGGDTLFCSAVDVLDRIIKTSVTPLKIEQHYSGSQESIVLEWCNVVENEIKGENVK